VDNFLEQTAESYPRVAVRLGQTFEALNQFGTQYVRGTHTTEENPVYKSDI